MSDLSVNILKPNPASKATRQVTRSLRDIVEGLWTREMEANVVRNAAMLGIRLKPVEWPDEVRI